MRDPHRLKLPSRQRPNTGRCRPLLTAALGLGTAALLACGSPGLGSEHLAPATGGVETALSNPTGLPTGGGEGYGDWVISYDVLVSTPPELLDALSSASASDVIYVDDDAVIDLTGTWSIAIPAGVTLASGRGRNGSLGALLRTTTQERRTLFKVQGPSVRITGLRFQGPTTVIDGPDCGGTDATGITVSSASLANLSFEIDNCELWAWPSAAVSTSRVEGSHIHHNHIHHNRRRERTHGCRAYGLGYGVVTNLGDALIEANLFNHNRHDIASTGRPGSSYEARYNLSVHGLISHSFDMHGCPDRPTDPACIDHPDTAGTLIDIHHNTFLQASQLGVVIRGIPEVGAWITNNTFSHASFADAIFQRYATGNLYAYANTYGFDPIPGWFISYSGAGYWTLRAFSSLAPVNLDTGDFDGDGTDDAFRTNGSRWFVSRSARSSWESWNTSAVELPALRFGRFDSNRTTDIFRSSGSRWYVSWSGRSRWQQINTSNVNPSSLRLGDFDGNGLTDVFRTNGSAWYVSWGGRSRWQRLNTSSVSLANLAFADLDGDGRTDVFYANGSRWYVSWGGQSAWEAINTSSRTVAQLGFCDFDGVDGADVFYADGSRWLVSWSGRSRWQVLNTSNLRLPDLSLADFNGDGKCDVLSRQQL